MCCHTRPIQIRGSNAIYVLVSCHTVCLILILFSRKRLTETGKRAKENADGSGRRKGSQTAGATRQFGSNMAIDAMARVAEMSNQFPGLQSASPYTSQHLFWIFHKKKKENNRPRNKRGKTAEVGRTT